MGGSPEARAQATQMAILAAARSRYARFGPHKTTMSEVAREAGCSRATLYTHFPGKDALYVGLLESETARFLADLEAAIASGRSARDRLRAVLESTVQNYAGSAVLRGALSDDDEMALQRVARPVVNAHEKRVVELLRRVLTDGIEEGVFRPLDAGAVAYLMYQLGRMLVARELSGRGAYPLERILEVMDDLLARGISNRENRP